jgi:UDP-sulfoquinovose synthase
MDTDLIWFYVRAWGLRATDLMQGPVYGIFTDESRQDDRLLPSFAYDELFGTVMNRFIVQAVAGYPLTVYGKGGQTRGYLNIVDTLQCVMLAAENPAESGELRVYNQFTETFSVKELAERVKRVGGDLGIVVSIDRLENPRKELEEHYYNPAHTGLLDLGLEPTYLTDDTLGEIIEKVSQFKHLISTDRFFRGVKW